MKQWWHKWSERIDAMVLRERAIVFFAAALVLLFLFNAALSGPVTDRQRQVARQLAQKQLDTRQIQEQVQLLLGQRAQDPDAERRAHIEQLKQRIVEIDARLAEKQHELVAPDRVPGLLEEMLRRERKLELVDLRSLPPAPLFESQAQPASGTAVSALQVYRHGVELTVRGNYFDLVRYLGDLEQLPLRMFWREVDISGDAYPIITMKLSVYTLSLERTWVVV
jgi:MSHA biogenesis protein MshJ